MSFLSDAMPIRPAGKKNLDRANEDYLASRTLYDSNGNTVGKAEFVDA